MPWSQETSGSTPILYIGENSVSFAEKAKQCVTDSQSTVAYDAETILLSSNTTNSTFHSQELPTSQGSVEVILQKKCDDKVRTQLRCCLALMRVICWDVDEGRVVLPPQCVQSIHDELTRIISMYDM